MTSVSGSIHAIWLKSWNQILPLPSSRIFITQLPGYRETSSFGSCLNRVISLLPGRNLFNPPESGLGSPVPAHIDPSEPLARLQTKGWLSSLLTDLPGGESNDPEYLCMMLPSALKWKSPLSSMREPIKNVPSSNSRAEMTSRIGVPS